MLKICAISDIHRHYRNIKRLQPAIESSDVIVIAGDLGPLRICTRWEAYKGAIAQIPKPIVAVHGNWDGKTIQQFLAPYSVHAAYAIINDIGFFGVGGSTRTPLNTPVEYSDEQITSFLSKGYEGVRHLPIKVLVTHNPPKNACDKTIFKTHAGSEVIATFCAQNPVELCICGHIHEARGVMQLGRTTVVNVGSLKQGYYGIINVALNGVTATIHRL